MFRRLRLAQGAGGLAYVHICRGGSLGTPSLPIKHDGVVPESASVVVRGNNAPGQRWLARILVPLITLAGAALVWASWGLAPWYVYALGVAVAAFGVWLQILIELSGRESLTVGGDGSIRIHSPGLLARDVRIDHQDVASVTYAEPALNQPSGETLFSLLGHGCYLRIELRDPRILPGVRWTNYVWCLRAESDPNYIAPPLPWTETAVLDFHTSPATAEAVLQLFAT
jgi:hypothetical protein